MLERNKLNISKLILWSLWLILLRWRREKKKDANEGSKIISMGKLDLKMPSESEKNNPAGQADSLIAYIMF